MSVLLAGGCNCQPATPSAKRPSAVVLITIDTLRADAVSFAESGPETTPFLSSLAKDGIIYERAYSPSSWTAPSMASLFTSLEPAAHGVVRGVIGGHKRAGAKPVYNQARLADSLTTMAESFRDAGFKTIGIAANRHLAAHLGFAQGFESYDRDASFVAADAVNRRVFQQLEEVFGSDWPKAWKRQPTFLWIHYIDPHAPYMAREPWAGSFGHTAGESAAGLDMPNILTRFGDELEGARAELEPLYWSEVRYTDDRISRLNDRLGLADTDVMVIVTSDHGEEFGEHGKLGHGRSLYEETIRVPLFLRWPDGLPDKGARITEPVSLLDLFPTLAKLLDLPAPQHPHGRPLPLTAGEKDRPPRQLFFESRRSRPRVRAVIDGNNKLIKRDFRNKVLRRRHRWELYELDTDPHETRNVAGRNNQLARRLEQRLQRHTHALPKPPKDSGIVEVRDPAVRERLRALGYDD